jgi:hypothetical protein
MTATAKSTHTPTVLPEPPDRPSEASAIAAGGSSTFPPTEYTVGCGEGVRVDVAVGGVVFVGVGVFVAVGV